jgi:hypothetical protein
MKMRLLALVIAAVVMVLGSLTGCSKTPGIEVAETINLTDSPQIPTAVLVRVQENIGVADSPEMLTPQLVTVTETVTLTDSVQILLPVIIRVEETINVVDTVVIQPMQALPTINYFTASPTTINRGQSSTLSWSVSNANSVIINNNIGQVAPTGTRVVSPFLTTTFTLTAANQVGSVTASVTIKVVVIKF